MKEDEYIDSPSSFLSSLPDVSRREFLKITGGGIIVFFTAGDTSTLLAQRGRRGYPEDFNAYLRIRKN